MSYITYNNKLITNSGKYLVKPGEIPVNFNIEYGRLYNWYAATNTNFAPAGWHVPTAQEAANLMLYLDPSGTYNVNTAGTALKESGNPELINLPKAILRTLSV